MPSSKLAKEAIVKEVLLFYEGPQLILLESSFNVNMLALAVEKEGYAFPFFTCEIRDNILNRYFDQKADLLFTFRNAARGLYYFFDFASLRDNTVKLSMAEDNEKENPAYWPEQGIFARSHTSEYRIEKNVSAIDKKFTIDGRWGASDFSHFHGKMSDLYALFSILNRIDSNEQDRKYIGERIHEKLWRGGGSYAGFYDDLIGRTKSISPLDVAEISYASPGYIALRGDADTLTDIDQVIDVFEREHKQLRKQYLSIHGILRKEKLLRAPQGTRFRSRETQQLVYAQAAELAHALCLPNPTDIYAACDKNTLVFSKVILSVYRRAKDIFLFHAEGRIQV